MSKREKNKRAREKRNKRVREKTNKWVREKRNKRVREERNKSVREKRTIVSEIGKKRETYVKCNILGHRQWTHYYENVGTRENHNRSILSANPVCIYVIQSNTQAQRERYIDRHRQCYIVVTQSKQNTDPWKHHKPYTNVESPNT